MKKESLFKALFIVFTFVFTTYNINAATIEVTEKTTLNTVVENAKNNDVIKLTEDITLTEAVSFDKNLTIDLNGHNITYATDKSAFEFLGEGEDKTYNVVFSNSATKESVITGRIRVVAKTSKYNLTIGKNVKLLGGYGVLLRGNGSDGSAVLNVYGSIEVPKTSDYAAIQGNGSKGNGGTIINIYDGAKITGPDAAIYHPQIGTLNITGGEITGYEAVTMKVGTLNISGGVFKATGDLKNPADGNNNGSEYTGAVIALTSNKAYPGDIEVNITGGKFIAEKSYALYEGISLDKNGNPVIDKTNVTKLNITGGEFKAGSDTDIDLYVQNEKDIDITIKNAKFAKGFNIDNTGTLVLGANTDKDKEDYPYTMVNAGITKDAIWNKSISNDLNLNTNIRSTQLSKVTIDGKELKESTDFYIKTNEKNITITLYSTTLDKLNIGNHTITLTINGKEVSKDLVIYEDLTLSNTTLSIDKMIIGSKIKSINVTDAVKNGLKPYTFMAYNLPKGLNIDAKTGVISGIPTEKTTSGVITVLVKDANNVTTIVSIPYCETSSLAKTTVKLTTVNYNTINLSWNEVEGATEYFIYRKTSSSSKYTMIASTKELTYSDDSVKTGTTYNYIVKASNDYTYTNSNKYTIKSIPGTVNEITLTESYNSVTLKWNKVDGATGYYIYRATSLNGKYTKIGSTTKLNYKNSSLTTNKTYYYKVVAYKTVNKKAVLGKESTIISATPYLKTTKVTGYNTYYEYARIFWTKVTGASAYRVYRSSTENGKYEYIGDTKNTYYNDKNVDADTTYYYKVKPYRLVNNSKKYAEDSNVAESSKANSTIKFTITSTNYNKLEVRISKVNTATKYKVYRATSKNGKYTLVKELLAKDFADTEYVIYTDTVTTGTTYYYKVKIANKNESNYSAVKSAKATPNVPNFTVDSNGKITIEKVSGATGYTIYKSKSGKDNSFTTLKATTNLTYTDTKLTSSPTYYAVKSYRTVNGKKVYSATYNVVSVNISE